MKGCLGLLATLALIVVLILILTQTGVILNRGSSKPLVVGTPTPEMYGEGDEEWAYISFCNRFLDSVGKELMPKSDDLECRPYKEEVVTFKSGNTFIFDFYIEGTTKFGKFSRIPLLATATQSEIGGWLIDSLTMQ